VLSAEDRAEATTSGTLETDGTILLSWLRLLGWQTATARDGELFRGVAEHTPREGATMRISASAPDEATLALQLFQAAMLLLERARTPGQHGAAAA